MRFWLPFDGDPVEESSFCGPYVYEIPNEGASLHVIDYGVNSRGREVDPRFIEGFGYACMSFRFVRSRCQRRLPVIVLRGVRLQGLSRHRASRGKRNVLVLQGSRRVQGELGGTENN